jgi:hypothetical protein
MVILSVLAFFSFTGEFYAEEPGVKNYVLMFQTFEYDTRLGDAVDYFLKEVITPEDNLLLFTPSGITTYLKKPVKPLPWRN